MGTGNLSNIALPLLEAHNPPALMTLPEPGAHQVLLILPSHNSPIHPFFPMLNSASLTQVLMTPKITSVAL